MRLKKISLEVITIKFAFAKHEFMIEKRIKEIVIKIVKELYHSVIKKEEIQLQSTPKEFEGDITIVVFPLAKIARKAPQQIGEEVGLIIQERLVEVSDYRVVKGFLNLVIDQNYWNGFICSNVNNNMFGRIPKKKGSPVVIEFSSPNTNKPMHLGHIRNNLLGNAIAKILDTSGKKVVRVNLINDRGIHICKSMIAWKKWGDGVTPSIAKKKGDKLAGDYYVQFEKQNKLEIKQKMLEGYSEEEAVKISSLSGEAREMLKKWEAGDEDIRSLWEKMNSWVYKGFDKTYKRMGIDFDKVYYESETYLLGRDIVKEGLIKGIFNKRKDGSVWADLTDEGLDEKLLLRSDGTSVYITQELGTAQLRYDDFSPGELLYVVGNEQNYHFDVLKIILKKLGKPWAEDITHISYGMVELPYGKMKSREGKVVDADDLMDEMKTTARETARELGKIEEFTEKEAEDLFELIGMGALKYFIIKVDPKKNMLFNPDESIKFDGNTGPFLQYTYARIQSLLRKAGEKGVKIRQRIDDNINISQREKQIVKLLHSYPNIIQQAAMEYSPAQLANYIYELGKNFNGFYQDTPVLRESDKQLVNFRLLMSKFTGQVIKSGMGLLGIEVPDRM